MVGGDGEGLLFANGAKVNPLTKANTHLVLIFCKPANNKHKIDSTYDSLWPPGSELSSSARGQAGHGNE